MGYSTDFLGTFQLDREMSLSLYREMIAFAAADHRIGNLAKVRYPSYYCSWVPTEKGDGIKWSGAEKFDEYTKWLRYIIKKFLVPAGHVLNGQVRWQGSEIGDIGILEVKDNKVVEHKNVLRLNFTETEKELTQIAVRILQAAEEASIEDVVVLLREARNIT